MDEQTAKQKLKLIEGKCVEVRHAKTKWKDAADKSLKAKKTFDTLSNELSDLIDGGPDTPLLDQADAEAA